MDKLKLMETFVKIVQTGSLVKASETLNISPSLASTHLKNLEGYLGSKLMTRSTRHVALTDLGKDYFEFCTKILAQVEEEERFLNQNQQSLIGNIKINTPMIGFSNLILAPTISRFLEMNPAITIRMVLSDTKPSPSYLTEGGFDLAVILGDLEDSSMIARRIGQVDYIACASPKYLSKCGPLTTPDDLVNHNCLIHLKASLGANWKFEQEGISTSVHVSGTLESNSIFLVRDATLSGLGIGILPTYCLENELETGELVTVLPSYHVEPQAIHVVFPYNRYLPYRIRAFIEYLTRALE